MIEIRGDVDQRAIELIGIHGEENVARVAGAFLGDGWIRHDRLERGYAVGLAIGTGEEAHTLRYSKLVEAVLPNAGWGRGWRVDAPGHFGLSCSSKSVWGMVVALGLGDRSPERKIPAWCVSLGILGKMALIGGYFDADGSISENAKNRGRGSFASASKYLMVEFRNLALELGLLPTNVRTKRRVTNFGECVVSQFVLPQRGAAMLPLWHLDKVARQIPNL